MNAALLFFLSIIAQTNFSLLTPFHPVQEDTEIKIPEAHLSIQLPNMEWHLATHTHDKGGQYTFKRDPIIDSAGRSIIPAIMIFVEDATKYQQDATLFTITKRGPFMKRGVSIDKTLIQSDKGYPLTYKNGFFMKASYTQDGIDHILYMINIINKTNQGIQVYLDMTKDIAGKYEQEFLTTIKSIREIN